MVTDKWIVSAPSIFRASSFGRWVVTRSLADSDFHGHRPAVFMNQHLLWVLGERSLWHFIVTFGSSRIAKPAYPVWPTSNRHSTAETGSTSNVRNILGFQDLGENPNQAHIENIGPSSEPINVPYPDNRNNELFPADLAASSASIRDVSQITSLLNGSGYVQAVDYEKVENAKKLTSSEYSFNAQLGYISLNQALNSDIPQFESGHRLVKLRR